MKKTYFIIQTVLLVIVQILLWNFLNMSQFLVICYMPAIILCLPVNMRPTGVMLIAALISFIVDFFSHGVVGLTAVALIPVAYSRQMIIKIVFGSEIFARNEDISFARQGMMKMMIAVIIFTVLFFIVYVWVDSAGTRTVFFNFSRLTVSSIISILVSLCVSALLTSERWR